MKVSFVNFRRIFLKISLLIPLLVLMVGLSLGLGIKDHSPAFAEKQTSPALIQNAPTVTRGGQRKIALEVAEESFAKEFGIFNLFIIFFVTLGPLKVIPTFVQLTQKASRTLKWQLAFRSTAVSTLVILLVVLIGRNLLTVWQIRLPALIIAGGILLSVVSLRLVLTQYTPNSTQIPPPDPPEKHLAITPLAFPTILPPFGIAIALTLMIVAAELGVGTWVVIVLLLLVMGLNLLSMLAAILIYKFIRPVTLKILGFTLGVMQFTLGIQFILTGLEIQTLILQILLQGQ